MSDKQAKITEIEQMLDNSALIAGSPFSVEQWRSIIKVIPQDQFDELYAYLILEKSQAESRK